MIEIVEVEQGTPEWLAMREELWTGSKAIKLLQGKPLPQDGGFAANQYMRRGSVLEGIALQEYTRETGRKAERIGFVKNSKHPNAGYSPDGIVGKLLLEVKCLNGARHEAIASGDIPLEYVAQIQFGLVICELERAELICYNPEYEKSLTIIKIKRDKAASQNIRKKLRADMKHRRLKASGGV